MPSKIDQYAENFGLPHDLPSTLPLLSALDDPDF